MIAGAPDKVFDKLAVFRDVIGDFGTLVATGHDWDKPGLWKRSMALLAEEVMPRFRQHCAATPC